MITDTTDLFLEDDKEFTVWGLRQLGEKLLHSSFNMYLLFWEQEKHEVAYLSDQYYEVEWTSVAAAMGSNA